jgi:hypothetical protein
VSASRLAWLQWVLTSVMAVAGLALIGAGETTPAFAAVEALMLSAIPAVGGIVARREPGNPCGWLVCAIPASFAAAILTDRLYEQTGSEASAWVETWIWIPAMLSIVGFAQLFPTGRPLTERWRPLLWLAMGAGPPLFVGTAFAAGPLDDYPDLVNPLGAPASLDQLVDVVGWIGFAGLIVGLLGAIVSLVIRFRRSVGVERQQLKWVACAAVLFPVAFAMPTDQVAGDDLGFAVLLLALFAIAVAVAIAILRYRLYDIDVVINRALVYVALTATLVAAYLVTVLLAQLVLPARSDLGVAVSTLAAAAVFAPARRRIQAVVDRRFFRRRYDAQRTLEAFGARLRDEVDLSVLSNDLRGVVAETMQPAHVSLWIRP